MRNYVIVVNWNGWKDTIECLESLMRLAGVDFRVVVCDNGSEDGSPDRIRAWAQGNQRAGCANPTLSGFSSPPAAKPIAMRELTREEAESGLTVCDEQLVLIQVGTDLGYAGGNNVGLRYSLHDPEARHFWLLNNDIVVDPGALSALVELMRQRPDAGMCGSLHLAYYNPSEVQAQGGKRYGRWTGRVLEKSRSLSQLDSRSEPIDYIHGASLMVTRSFVEQVGLLDESYFIYFEELDWVARAKGRFALAYTPTSVIYHKEGAAIGTNANRRKRSLTAERYYSKNRIVFAKRYCPWTLPTVMLTVLVTAVHRMCTGYPAHAKAMLAWAVKGLFAGPAVYKTMVAGEPASMQKA